MIVLNYVTLDAFFAHMPKHADVAVNPGGNAMWVLPSEMVGTFSGPADAADPRFKDAVISDSLLGFGA